MIGRSIVTLAVADVDRSIKFYVEKLGFKLRYRAGDKWAEVDGPQITIGLHGGGHGPPPGARGSIAIGLEVEQPLEEVVEVLANRSVKFEGPIVKGAVRLIAFGDPDGNALYLCEPYRPAH